MRRLGIPALLAAVLALSAPRFLLYSEPAIEAEAVVLFIGGDYSARLSEAMALLAEGRGRLLIVPAHGRVLELSGDGGLMPIAPQGFSMQDVAGDAIRAFSWEYGEETHREALAARAMMGALGLRSANLVSSPYHMRRISIISGRVFGGGFRYACVPSRFVHPAGGPFWALRDFDRSWVLSELAKTAWFLVYSPFIGPLEP